MRTDPAHRRFVAFIDKSRDYYAAQGYDRPYRWARPPEPPHLHRPAASLSGLRLGLITTAYPLPADGGPPPKEQACAHPADPLPSGRFTADDNRDRGAADANELGSFLPLEHLAELAGSGRVGSLSSRYYGIPFDYSQRQTIEEECPALLGFLREDAVDVAMVVPHCPVCHQSAALAARHLEQAGIATVLVGSARDIIEEIGVPRFLFTDLPLGYPVGRPGDADQQRDVCRQALDLLEGATAARTTVHAVAEWGDDAWREDYMRVDDSTRAGLAAAGEARRDDQARARRT